MGTYPLDPPDESNKLSKEHTKVERLIAAIRSMRQLRTSLQALRDDITGEAAIKKEVSPPEIALRIDSIADLLVYGPDYLLEEYETCHKAIEEIRIILLS